MSRISNILKVNIKKPALIDSGHLFISAINTEYNEDYIYYIGTSGTTPISGNVYLYKYKVSSSEIIYNVNLTLLTSNKIKFSWGNGQGIIKNNTWYFTSKWEDDNNPSTIISIDISKPYINLSCINFSPTTDFTFPITEIFDIPNVNYIMVALSNYTNWYVINADNTSVDYLKKTNIYNLNNNTIIKGLYINWTSQNIITINNTAQIYKIPVTLNTSNLQSSLDNIINSIKNNSTSNNLILANKLINILTLNYRLISYNNTTQNIYYADDNDNLYKYKINNINELIYNSSNTTPWNSSNSQLIFDSKNNIIWNPNRETYVTFTNNNNLDWIQDSNGYYLIQNKYFYDSFRNNGIYNYLQTNKPNDFSTSKFKQTSDLVIQKNNYYINYAFKGEYDGNNYKINITNTTDNVVTPLPLNITYTQIDSTNGIDGSIILNVTGSYNKDYSWTLNNVIISTNKDLLNIGAGTYICTINSGIETQVITVIINGVEQKLILSGAAVPSSTGYDGSIILTANSASGILKSYSWTINNTFISASQNLYNIGAGTYICTVNAGSETKTINIVVLGVASSLIISEKHVEVTKGSNGYILLTVNGGFDIKNYSWFKDGVFFSSQQNLNKISFGTYVCTVTSLYLTSTITIVLVAPTIVVLPYNKSIDFNGTQSGISSMNITFGGNITLEFYIYPRSIGSIGTYPRIFQFGQDSSAFALSFENSTLQTYVPGDGWQNTTATLTLNKWQHIALVLNGTSRFVYIDGMLNKTYTGNALATTSRQYSWGDGIPATSKCVSYMAEFRCWNYSRSAEEILNNYNQIATGTEANLFFAFSTINTVSNSTLLVDKTGTRVLNFNALNIITTDS